MGKIMNEKTCVLVFADEQAESYFKYCLPEYQKWCSNKNYTLKIFKENKTNSAPMWMKIKLLYDELENNEFQIIIVMDADMIINNLNLDLNSFLKPDKDIYICKNEDNGGEYLNTGSIMIKNTENSKQFINEVWGEHNNEYANKYWWEQTIVNKLYSEKYSSVIEPLGMRDINSHWQCDKINHPKNNIYHFMARDKADKVVYVKTHFNIA